MQTETAASTRLASGVVLVACRAARGISETAVRSALERVGGARPADVGDSIGRIGNRSCVTLIRCECEARGTE
ncbi:hypothetical protein C477_01730 [Haloterrigena salina JCM 13891]|uniref:Uncharacterized protein n=1 Tax=Haloterrigena salina JCM 13891 TaxID=1227488 RepID=M0CML5_9EURY|nr:hypothetical protein C477_01730 [Haloterrigena salina JCM 13891]